jgi:hypothetical protein
MSDSEQKNAMQIFLDQVLAEAEKASSEKVTKAMRLFVRLDGFGKRCTLHASGFSGRLNAVTLREHFDTLDLMDGLDILISDMEGDIEHSE